MAIVRRKDPNAGQQLHELLHHHPQDPIILIKPSDFHPYQPDWTLVDPEPTSSASEHLLAVIEHFEACKGGVSRRLRPRMCRV
jgi:hypothetical protein